MMGDIYFENYKIFVLLCDVCESSSHDGFGYMYASL